MASNSTGGSVFKSCSSVEIIKATTEQIELETENFVTHVVIPLTPITRIPGAVINKKLIKFETPRIGSCDSRHNLKIHQVMYFLHQSVKVILVKTSRLKIIHV